MVLKLSTRSDIDTFRALDNLQAVGRRVKAGEDIIRLEAGQPCFGVPEPVLVYARDRLQIDPRQGYTDALGMQLLRARIAAHTRDRYGVDLDWQRVAVTTGSSCGFIIAFLAAFDAGDVVGICTPTYPAYRNILQSLDIEVVEIQTNAETNYQPTAALLESCGVDLDGVIVCSPSNPTGTMIAPDVLEEICRWCEKSDVRLISDEAYHGITYEQAAHSALQYSDQVIVTNSFSKYFAMTGWRAGWISAPEDMMPRIKKLAESLFVSPPTLSQHVAYKIFDHLDLLDAYVAQYEENRDILREGLPQAGLRHLSGAEGAFYFYADISALSQDSTLFCEAMLAEAGVSCTAGVDFDPTRGNTTLRISYAGEPDHMREACARLARWLL